jgi:hypothetical protein
MNNNINNILEKYWNAETNLQEEAVLRAYFASADVADNHKEFAGLFYYISQVRLGETSIDVNALLHSINDVDILLDKYWNAETSIDDEVILKAYFSSTVAPEHIQYKALFDFYGVAGEMTTELEFDIEATNSNDDIDNILDKFLNTESTFAEERALNAYFKSFAVSEMHAEYIPLFAYFEQAASMTTDIDLSAGLILSSEEIDPLVEKYWNAETSLEEEEVLHVYFSSDQVSDNHIAIKDLFFFYGNQRKREFNLDIEQLLNEQVSSNGAAATDNAARPLAKEAKVFSLRKLTAAIAAIFVLGFAAVTVMNQSTKQETQYRGKSVSLDTEAEAKEAYEITKQAFALLSKNMNQGSETMKSSIKEAKKASIFK